MDDEIFKSLFTGFKDGSASVEDVFATLNVVLTAADKSPLRLIMDDGTYSVELPAKTDEDKPMVTRGLSEDEMGAWIVGFASGLLMYISPNNEERTRDG